MSGAVEVIYLAAGLGTGGTERHLARLLPGLAHEGFRPRVLNAGETGAAADVLLAAGIAIESFTAPVSVRHVSVFTRLLGRLRQCRPALVHSYLYGAHWLDALAARLAGIPYVGTRRNLAHWRAGAVLARERWRDRNSVVIVANSEAAARVALAEGAPSERLQVIANGVPLSCNGTVGTAGIPASSDERRAQARATLGLPAAARVVGTVTSLKKIKAPEVLLAAFARRPGPLPDDRLVFIGDGPEAPALEQQAEVLGLSDAVVMAGEQTEPQSLLPAFDVFALASRSEGFSNAVVEAMAAGLPVVATAVGGNTEAVQDGVTGRLVPANDEVALAAALGEMLADPARAFAVGARGRQRVVEHYSLQTMVDAHADLYGNLLADKKTTS